MTQCNCKGSKAGHDEGCPLAAPATLKLETDALAVVEKRYTSYPLVSLNTEHLLLLDIAHSLREQTRIAREGLEFSQGLAKLFETQN